MSGFNQQYTEQLLPAYFLGPDGFPYFNVSAEMKDNVASAAIDAVQDSFVQTAPVDALDPLGVNFFIDRPPPFTDEQWRAELVNHVTFWQTSGTPARLITEIKNFGYPTVTILPEWLETSPGVFVKSIPEISDANPAMDMTPDASGQGWWSNFWVIIGQPHPFTIRTWGSIAAGKWGTGDPNFGKYKWGSVSGDTDALASLVALIKKLKPAWTSCRGLIFIIPTGVAWGSFNWGDGTKWGFVPGTYGVEYILEDWEIIEGNHPV